MLKTIKYLLVASFVFGLVSNFIKEPSTIKVTPVQVNDTKSNAALTQVSGTNDIEKVNRSNNFLRQVIKVTDTYTISPSIVSLGSLESISVPAAKLYTPVLVATPVAPIITQEDLEKVCRAAIATLFGRDIRTIRNTKILNGIVYNRYSRPDDGKVFKNRCKITGNKVIWAGIDIFGPGTGPGRWRVHPADEVITYSINGNFINITLNYNDGSKFSESFNIE